ncbi:MULTISPECIES: hypothetical protein [unclassified Amycolatopsis]|uniref:hypothetical protein n=1 Tax=unclassified Amycolatopsis TaxID=2618356 RepID=UPI0028743FB9|nr:MULTISPECIES: hypothetical protein [unclassified Amycolatopsis]MDS0140609.1 hypothetical protein [Amycolatopsis sp. 505]MDS0149259.1 hypothetical protein [Amycolatopsis sp. CM201R]
MQPASPAGSTVGPTANEVALVDWVRRLASVAQQAVLPSGWRYPNVPAFLAAHGRLFRPTAEPVPSDRRGRVGECWFNAATYADRNGVVYVEGWATEVFGWEIPHAWCASGEEAVEPTSGWEGDFVYLGVPFADEFRRSVHRRNGVGSLLWEFAAAKDLLEFGPPAGAVVPDVGRPLPPIEPGAPVVR